MHELHNTDNLKFLVESAKAGRRWDVVFADPPDNINLGYNGYKDRLPEPEYEKYCLRWLLVLLEVTDTVWWSFNARHTVMMGSIVHKLGNVECKPCVQTFTFGQHNKHDLGNNHRPLWRISNQGKCRLFPEQIKVPSWRELNGDKRAKPGGRVPGDVFDFPRVTGNSKQRRRYHPTQLHEGLVERCIKLTTKEGDSVLDPFGGTGTTLRVCKRINRNCTLVEIDPYYCRMILDEPENFDVAYTGPYIPRLQEEPTC